MSNQYKIFISHSWKHSGNLAGLRRLLNNRGYFNVTFQEVPRHDPINSGNANYIKGVLSRKISDSNIILGIAGVYASYSDWMEWELDKGIQQGIPIIGVVPRGQLRISKTVTDRSIIDVNWNTESIVNAIRTYSN